MSSPPGPAQPRYWPIAVLLGLLLIPGATAGAALIAAGAGALLLAGLRAALRRRARSLDSTPGAEAVALGSDAEGRPVLLSEQQLSAHGLILGASGAGKSTTLLAILTEQVRRGRPVLAIDLKGSPGFAHELGQAAAGSGRPFRLWTLDGPGRWNPLQHGNATELKDKLISTERFTEPHYQRAAERYVQTVMQVLLELAPGRSPTLEQVVALMDPRRMAGLLRRLPSARSECVQDYLSTLTSDQHSAIRGLGTRLAIISESHTGRYLSPSGSGEVIDLRRALEGPEVVLFSLNSSRYGKLSAQLGALVLQDLSAAVGHRLTLPTRRQAIIGIDEFSALGADNVMALLARGREAGASVLLATQELADLDRAAPGLRDQVLGNTAVKIAHRQDVPASAQTIAQLAGTEKVWEHSEQVGGRLFAGRDTGRGTRRQVEQFIVHPNEIKTLTTGQAVLITKVPSARTRTVRVTPHTTRITPPTVRLNPPQRARPPADRGLEL